LNIFKLAFTHKSNTESKNHAITSNERLEFLGDALLSTIVAEYLFKKYPNSDEGFLTKMRSKIVKRKTLNEIADDMALDVLLLEYNDTRLSDSMKGNALEALVGAIYLEKGYRKTKSIVIRRILMRYLNIHALEDKDDNYKSQLLEWCQKKGRSVDYRLIEKFKFENRDRFKIAVVVNGDEVAIAEDFNKKSAEQTASKKAILSLGISQNGIK
jgi:ribonuclease-3